ncbi:MAG: hypothetical protein Q9226_005531 [Calogaya cf. arnoldii]
MEGASDSDLGNTTTAGLFSTVPKVGKQNSEPKNMEAQSQSLETLSDSSTACTTQSPTAQISPGPSAQTTTVRPAPPTTTVERQDLVSDLLAFGARRRELRIVRDRLQSEQDEIIATTLPLVRQVQSLRRSLRGLLDEIGEADERLAALEFEVQDNALNDRLEAIDEKYTRKQLRKFGDGE